MHSNELTDYSGGFHGSVDTQPPSDELDAWTEAENAAMRIMCEATGHTLGQNAFIGEIDDIMNSFWITNETTQMGGEVFYAPKQPALPIPYQASAMFDSRRGIQRFVMALVRALPVRGDGCLDQLRFSANGIGPIKLELVEVRGETKPRLAFIVDLHFDVVVRVL